MGLGQGAPAVSAPASWPPTRFQCVLCVRHARAQLPPSPLGTPLPRETGLRASSPSSRLSWLLGPLNFRRKCHWGRGEGGRLEVTLACPLSGVFRSGTWAGAPASRPPPLPAASAWLLRARVSPKDVAAEAAGAGPRARLRIQVFRAAAQNARNCRTSISWPQLG